MYQHATLIENYDDYIQHINDEERLKKEIDLLYKPKTQKEKSVYQYWQNILNSLFNFNQKDSITNKDILTDQFY